MAATSPVRRIGRYEIHDEFARGGMARVHFGRLVGPVGFARAVAIKCLHPGYAADSTVARMFMDEARVTSRMRHPNVVPIVDVLAVEGDLYLVMDYVPGLSLSRLLARLTERGETVPVPVTTSVMIGVFSGLHAAHETTGDDGEPLRIVHRDVSPQNVLVGADGVARVLDFGVAKAASRAESTAAGQIKGKIAYMAPEQLAGAKVDHRSDIFAACIVLWELLTQRKLFAREDAGATVLAATQAEIEPPSRHNGNVSPELDALVLRGLQRVPEDRWQTALDVVRALETVGRSASTREVSDWMRSLAGETLAHDAKLVADIEGASVVTAASMPAPESMPAPIRMPAPTSSASAAGGGSHPAVTATAPSASAAPPLASGHRTRWQRGVLGACVLLGVAAAAIWVQARRPASAPVGDAVSSAALTAPPAAEPVTTLAPTAVVTAVTVAAPPAGTASAAPQAALSAASRRSATQPRAPGAARAHPAPGHVAAAPAPPAPCRVVNADGTFGYRAECLKQ